MGTTMTTQKQRGQLEKLMSSIGSAPRAVAADRRTKGVSHKEVAVESESQLTGRFTAKISDWSVDRQNERFAPAAFDGAIARLRDEGRPIPVLFGHDQTSLQAVLGHVMPDGLHALADGLYAHGWIDTSTDVGAKVHEMLRRDVLRWSVGFTLKRAHQDDGGVRVLDEVDELLELSAVPVPSNSRTGTLAAKSAEDEKDEHVPTHTEVERRLIEHGIVTRPADEQAIYDETRDQVFHTLGIENGDHRDKAVEPKQRRYNGQVTVVSFDA